MGGPDEPSGGPVPKGVALLKPLEQLVCPGSGEVGEGDTEVGEAPVWGREGTSVKEAPPCGVRR